ncbi:MULTISPECIES: acetyl-CoA carboxylase biotin carboxylase subunit [unclassified Nocardioides]|uniref:acetyl-CoA carboxylase biotin carboxylase subunit n=1 Tax=unclassified Nocardioides TaxID=2615069 RepID=UPI0007010900|nr:MULTISPECIES: biotin carboxylase N-terminal domain-containing protein [unclassified Nocardioides]KQY63489.1 biotin carboxylase [Nocardioides sp. Root140]KRF17559.1 biotin carboxylase [Nocardioides sp. Soil796]
MFESVLIANRGEIASRVIRTAKKMGLRTIAVHSDADQEMPFVAEADEAVLIGPAPARQSYLDMEKVLEAAQRTGAQAIHPGYGFLAENPTFAAAVAQAGLTWVGPDASAIEALGDKVNARNIMAAAGVPVAPGSGTPATSLADAVAHADRIGFPLMVKASAGGGGIGMGVAHDASELEDCFATALSRAERFFGSPDILLERFIANARHVEIQILVTNEGEVITLGERDCSLQRRHQKILEETPSPGVSPDLRQRMLEGARRAGSAIGYRNAGTVECLVDPVKQDYVFLEMNTRLQVEHAITELTTGVDLVEQQFLIAGGQSPTCDSAPAHAGHAIELRICAEDPVSFLPSPGQITGWIEPRGEGVRVDSGYRAGNSVSPHYDSLLAKLCTWGADRDQAIARARVAAGEFQIEGVKTNLGFLQHLLDSQQFVLGDYDTHFVETSAAPAWAGPAQP